MTPTLPDGLLAWAFDHVPGAGKAAAALEAVAGDAGNRRYFRLRLGDRSVVLVHAPPATENNHAFVQVARLFAAGGVRVPEVIAVDHARGFLLLEDLGDALLLSMLDSASVDRHYGRASQLLVGLAALDVDVAALPDYDAGLLGEELGRFPAWFVTGLLQYRPDAAEAALWEDVVTRLTASALEQPRVVVHRDFHSRNLMLLAHDELAVIDFQDAVRGPVTYDLVSLLRDCYVRWPDDRVRGWALGHRDTLVAAALLPDVSDDRFLRWFDLMGLQRHLKVLGNFARLSVRDGRHDYLADLPLVIGCILDVLEGNAAAEPAFGDFARWFRTVLLPRARARDWGAAL